MLFKLPREPASSGAAQIEDGPANSESAAGSKTLPFHTRHRALGARHEIPDRSKHSVSPCALSAALLKFTDVGFSDTDDDDSETFDALRKYKRARIDETSAWLKGGPLLPEAGASTGPRIKQEASGSVNIDEDSYWEGAFKQAETKPTKVATEGTSQSARRLLFEYGRRNTRPTPVLQLSKCDAEASASATLPYRPRSPAPLPQAVNAADNATDDVSEDEGFAIVYHAQATGNSTPRTQMSSPELIPSVSIAKTMIKDEASSDDEWTDVEPLI